MLSHNFAGYDNWKLSGPYDDYRLCPDCEHETDSNVCEECGYDFDPVDYDFEDMRWG